MDKAASAVVHIRMASSKVRFATDNSLLASSIIINSNDKSVTYSLFLDVTNNLPTATTALQCMRTPTAQSIVREITSIVKFLQCREKVIEGLSILLVVLIEFHSIQQWIPLLSNVLLKSSTVLLNSRAFAQTNDTLPDVPL